MLPRLQQLYRQTLAPQLPGADQAGEAGTHHHHINQLINQLINRGIRHGGTSVTAGNGEKMAIGLPLLLKKPATGNGHGAADDTAVSSFPVGETVTLPLYLAGALQREPVCIAARGQALAA